MPLDDTRPKGFSWATPTPPGWRSWGLAAHASAVTLPHTDCAGLCTWVHLPFGEKLWFVASKPEKDSFGDLMQEAMGEDKFIDYEALDFVLAFLQGGDEL